MASVYTNDLRLEEIGSGEQSGTWGDTTNTNLELIAEGLSYGTEAITTNADTHTSTVADGATDPARSMYIEYTGTLDSTCTITIAPNSLSRVHIIENGTSGSQDIIIKQGSGATVTIPPGHKKVVYLDGAGSGAAVVDAFTDLNVPSLFIKNPGTGDDSTALLTLQTTEADIAADDVLGKISFQAPNEGTGTDAILVAASIQAKSEGDFSSSSNATSLEFMTGASEAAATKMSLTSGGDLKLTTDSSVLGFGADNDTTLTHTDGTGLTLNSTNKLCFNDASQFVQGSSATVLSLGATDEIDLTATAIDINGTVAISGDTTIEDGADIITATAGTSNVRVGVNAGNSIQSGGNYNTVVGDEAGTALTTGDSNVLVGMVAGDALDVASDNVAVGQGALTADTKGSKSVAIGRQALTTQNFTTATDTYNTAVGYHAGLSVTTGDKNTIVGSNAGDALTTGNKNTVLGYNALGAGTTYDGNVAIGMEALKVADLTTGADANNTAVGTDAGSAVTTGVKNVIVGVSAAGTLTTGSDNICIGRQADVSASGGTNQITIGIDINAGGDNNFSFGKASNVVTNDFDSDANWSRSSDKRKKREIYDQELGLDFVNDLRTVNFQWKPSNEFPKEWNDYSKENNMDTDVVMHGFIAQEVKEALDKHSSERDSNFSGWKEGEDGMQHTSREMFVIPLIKAVQELSAQVDTLKAEIKELKDE